VILRGEGDGRGTNGKNNRSNTVQGREREKTHRMRHVQVLGKTRVSQEVSLIGRIQFMVDDVFSVNRDTLLLDSGWYCVRRRYFLSEAKRTDRVDARAKRGGTLLGLS
jgi:hypothetical protein